MKSYIFLIGLLLLAANCYAQEADSSSQLKKLNVSGYLKQLSILNFNKDFTENIADNFLHQRLNFSYEPSSSLRLVVDFRNRLFWGESVQNNPTFSSQLKNTNDWWNLQKAWINNQALVLHTNVERLNVELHKEKWNMRVGRQRINWGMSTTWNPNDIFNAYNFLDFDYEERPGVDGAKFQYLISDLSDIQLVYAKTRNKKDIIAFRYFFNKNKYDMQLIGSWYRGRPSIGAGWAGNIKESGFRGEIQQYFAGNGEKALLNISTEMDHVFKNGWYSNLGILYNSNGINHPINDFSEVNLSLSAENLMPGKWSLLSGFSKEITSVWSGNFTTVYSPGMNLLIMIGGFKYELGKNLDIDLICQSYFVELNSVFQSSRNAFFLRLKWSY